MDRGKIKIIEFGKDDDSPGAPAAGTGGTRPMKIVEFDDDPGGGTRRPPGPKEVGRIRIVEFDDAPPAASGQRAFTPSDEVPTPRPRIGSIKIKEFGEEDKERPRGTGRAGSRIKIMEFD